MKHNGARHKLGKEGDKAGIVQKRIAGRLTLVPVNHIGNLLEGKKADSQRQGNFLYMPVRVQKEITVIHKKVEIFEIEEQSDICANSHDKKQPPQFLF